MIGTINKRAAVITVALLMFATPAAAGLIVRNYMQANVESAQACFVKIAGDDASSYTGGDGQDPLAAFDGDATALVNGVELTEEQLTVRGMRGDQVIYTDVVRYQNRCNIPLAISLVAQGAGDGDWNDRAARIYLSANATAINGAEPTLGSPLVANSGWDPTPIIIGVGGILPVTNQQTGAVTVGPGQELRGAVMIAAGVNSSDNQSGSIEWIAQAVNNN